MALHLRDSPLTDHADELPRCQRFYLMLGKRNFNWHIFGLGIAIRPNRIDITTPASLRANCVITVVGTFVVINNQTGSNIAVSSVEASQTLNNLVSLEVTPASNAINGAPYFLHAASNVDASISLNANL